MAKALLALFLALIGIFIIDQGIKEIVMLRAMDLYGLHREELYTRVFDIYQTSCINLRLVFNEGVAFSLLAFLQGWLKWIQLILIAGVLIYIIRLNKTCYALPSGILIGAGLSNVYDRFIHGGVVDYIYWHCGFNFAIFNFADIIIDIAILWLLFLNFRPKWCQQKKG